MTGISILDLLSMDCGPKSELHLRCIAGKQSLGNMLTINKVNRPGLTLSGFLEEFSYDVLQVFGKGEQAYLSKLIAEGNFETVEQMLSYPIPAVIFSGSYIPDERFLEIANKHNVPVLVTSLRTSEFEVRVLHLLREQFAPTKSIHGVLLEVFGLGVLITGESGVGKSEIALELIERNHRLISDDVVRLKCIDGNFVMGTGENPDLAHHMEIRGIGIINIAHLFGIRAIRDRKQVQLWVRLESWNPEKDYERVGEEEFGELFGVPIPEVTIPVKPGRNIPIIIETAAMNQRLRKLGYNSAEAFDNNVLKWLESKASRELYYRDSESV